MNRSQDRQTVVRQMLSVCGGCLEGIFASPSNRTPAPQAQQSEPVVQPSAPAKDVIPYPNPAKADASRKCYDAAFNGDVEKVVDYILDGNVDLTIGYGPRKNTALHAATIIRNVKIVEVLLKNGANIHVEENVFII